jgi:pimeloyl-ACP methyl ester carboxylesterase
MVRVMQLIPEALSGRALHALGHAQYRAATSLARRVLGARRRSARIDGVDVPYFFRPARRAGDPPVVLVHGFGGDKESWLFCASFLKRSRGLVIPDLPGFGAAGGIPGERACARQQAKVVAVLLDHVGARRAHLVGNSMGGGVALRFAADYPGRAVTLGLLGSVGPFVEKSEVGLAFDRGENPLIIEAPEDIDRLLALVAERPPPSTRAMRRYLGADRYARREAQGALFDGWVHCAPGDGPPDGDALAAIAVPTIVIHGENDRVIHPATGRALYEKLPDARLELMAGVGHVPQMEKPKRTAAILDAFIDSVAI